MPTTYTPTSTGAPVLAYEQVSDGDKRKAASINPGLSGMADDIARIANGTQVTSPTLTAWFDQFEYSVMTGTGTPQVQQWARCTATSGGVVGSGEWQQMNLTSDVRGDSNLIGTMTLPHGCTLLSLDLWIAPAGGHGALPASKPSLALYQYDPTTDAVVASCSQIDTSATLLAYEVRHSVQIGAFTIGAAGLATIDRTKQYKLRILGEFGSNAIASNTGGATLRVLGVKASFTTSKIDGRAA